MRQAVVMSLKILIVLTSHAALGGTGKPTGYYLPELTHALQVFEAAGVQVDLASPKGGEPPMDGADRKDPINARYLDDTAFRARLKTTRSLDQVRAQDYAAIYVPGGHGTMWDLPDDVRLQRLIAGVWTAGGVVASVCHGPAALVNVRLPSGELLVKGRTVSAFTNEEEAAVGLTTVVPFLLQTALERGGAKVVTAPKFQAQISVDGRLVTGQNPASAAPLAEAVVKLLREKR